MDVKAILKDMSERCEKDDDFKQLVENDFAEALKSCGVDSTSQFIQAVKSEGLLTDEDIANVSGGIAPPTGTLGAGVGISFPIITGMARCGAIIGG